MWTLKIENGFCDFFVGVRSDKWSMGTFSFLPKKSTVSRITPEYSLKLWFLTALNVTERCRQISNQIIMRLSVCLSTKVYRKHIFSDLPNKRPEHKREYRCVFTCEGGGGWVEGESADSGVRSLTSTVLLVFDREDFLSAGCLPGALCVQGWGDQHLTSANDPTRGGASGSSLLQKGWWYCVLSWLCRSFRRASIIFSLLDNGLDGEGLDRHVILPGGRETLHPPLLPSIEPCGTSQGSDLSLSIGRGPPCTQTRSRLPLLRPRRPHLV